MRDYKKDYEFWKGIVENSDGSINKEQLMKELSDFSLLIDNITNLIDRMTGGKASYATTNPDTVIELLNEELQEMYERGYEDGLAHAETWELADLD